MKSSNSNPPFANLLAVFAHPDDESFTSGGVFAALRDVGVAVTLVCATRGEAGEISDPKLATKENLGEVREQELRTAMDAVGVDDIRFLGYRDSGMAGTPENEDPRSLAQAADSDVTRRIIEIIEELNPEVVLTFDPEGIYGHPDHIAVYRATTDAVVSANDRSGAWRPEALFYATLPREWFLEVAARPNSVFENISLEVLNKMGVPRAEITHVYDVSPFLEQKRATMHAHKTQFGIDGPFEKEPRELVDRWLSREHFIRFGLPWNDPSISDDPLTEALSAAGVSTVESF